MALLEFTPNGILCPEADVYIDPWKPVPKALVTHGHSDHARPGHGHYLCTEAAAPVIRHRLGAIRAQTIRFGEERTINGVQFTFFPAGHIPGSAQIRVSRKGETWVVSGDYKVEPDRLSEAFEPIRCHTFITESTFGLPVYRWQPQEAVFEEIAGWWRNNRAEGKISLLSAYALGKAQRIIRNLDFSIGPVYVHGAVDVVNRILHRQGFELPPTGAFNDDTPRQALEGSLIIAPPAALNSAWTRRFKNLSTATASGWMNIRGARRRRSVDRGFALSDHADWDGLNRAIRATGAEQVFVTHGYTAIFAQWLREQGLDAKEVRTEFGEEEV